MKENMRIIEAKHHLMSFNQIVIENNDILNNDDIKKIINSLIEIMIDTKEEDDDKDNV